MATIRETIRELADYYVERLIAQYRTLPKARDTVAIVVKQALADDLATQVQNAFDVDSAVGAQLDVIGKYVGVPRNIGAPNSQGFFGLWSYGSTLDPTLFQSAWEPASDSPTIPAAAGGNAGWWYVASAAGTSATPIVADWLPGDVIVSDGSAWAKQTSDNGNGLTTYADLASNMNGIFYSYSTTGRTTTDLTDESYRTVIKLKIILNTNDGTLASIVGLLKTFFPSLVFCQDGANMTMTYLVVSSVPLAKSILETYLPKPMGVGITVIIISPAPSGGDRLTTEDGFTLTTEDGSPLTTETPSP